MKIWSKWYLKWRLSSTKDEIWETSRALEQIDNEIAHLEKGALEFRRRLSAAMHLRQKLEKEIASLEQAE